MATDAYRSTFSERQPLVLPVLAFMAGIALGGAWASGWTLAGALTATLLALGWKRHWPAYLRLALLCLGFAGWGAFSHLVRRWHTGPDLNGFFPKPGKAILVGEVQDGQAIPRGKYALTLQLQAFAEGHHWQRAEATLQARLPATYSPPPGTRLLLEGFYVPNLPKTGNPLWQGYRQTLDRQQIAGSLFLPEGRSTVKVLSNPNPWQPYVAAHQAALHLNRLLDQTLGVGPEAAVAKALLLGTRESLTEDLRQDYAACGAIHLLVVSGGHLVLLWGLLFWLLKRLPLRWQGLTGWVPRLGVVGLLWVFAFLAGLGPSIVRAAWMLTLVQLGTTAGRPSQGLNALAGACWLMLALNPLSLFSLGFQLSVGCVAGILVLTPKLAALWHPRFKAPRLAWQAFCTTMAAQAGALPFTLLYFGQFPVWFWLANPPAILLTEVILWGLIVLLALASCLQAFLGASVLSWLKPLAWLNLKMLGLLNAWMSFIAAMPYAVRDGWYLTAAQALLVGLALVWLATLPKGIGFRHAFYGFLLATGWCMSSLMDFHTRSRQRRSALALGPAGFYRIEQQGLTLQSSSPLTADGQKLAALWGVSRIEAGSDPPLSQPAIRMGQTLLVRSRSGLPQPIRQAANRQRWQLFDLSREGFYVWRDTSSRAW